MEFLRYPQLIPALFNVRVVRTSTVLYHRFILSMDRSPGFGSTARNFRPFETRFRFGSGALHLNLAAYSNSPARSTKSTWSLSLPLLVNTGFQVLFHSPPGVLFTFPSRYCSSIGHQVVFRLGGWSPRLPTGFHVSGGTLDPVPVSFVFGYVALTLFDRPSHAVPLTKSTFSTVLNPRNIATPGLASTAFARHYLRYLF